MVVAGRKGRRRCEKMIFCPRVHKMCSETMSNQITIVLHKTSSVENFRLEILAQISSLLNFLRVS